MSGSGGPGVRQHGVVRSGRHDVRGAGDADRFVEHLSRLSGLLSAAPEDFAGPADLAAADTWLAEAEELLEVADGGERARLLEACAAVRRRIDRGGTDAAAVEDEEEAAQLYEQLGEDTRAATAYVRAAVGALTGDDVSTALDLAVRGIVAFHAAPVRRAPVFAAPTPARGVTVGAHPPQPEPGAEPDAEIRMAHTLALLCREFSDHERALCFAEIALGEAGDDVAERPAAAAAGLYADLALIRYRELGEADRPAEMLSRAEVIASALSASAGPVLSRRVTGPRLLAEVRCEQGRPEEAEPLLGPALEEALRLSRREEARQELCAVRRARARCLWLLGRHHEALTDLDAVLADPAGQAVAAHLDALRLRSRIREQVGDLAGALADTRDLADLVADRHERRIGGFLQQVWSLAARERHLRRLRARHRDLLRTAEQDVLTGLANRRGLQRFCTSLGAEEALSLVLVDVDHFKGVNDTFGHQVGDVVLRTVAEVLSSSVRIVDRVSRWGGEEFLVALPGPSAAIGADAAARMRRRIAETDWAALTPGLSVTVSAGVSFGRARDLTDLLADADRALYRAKREGRDRVATSDGDARGR